jgi:hypothetical protein
MGATPVTGIRIPPDLLALIDARAIEGKTRTDIVIALIRAGLGVEPSIEGMNQPDRYTALNERVTELEGSVLQVFNNRLTELETTVKQSLDNRATVVKHLLDNRLTTVEQVLDNRLTQVFDECETPVKQSSENAPQNLHSASAEQSSVKQGVKQRQTVTERVAPQNYGFLPPIAAEGLSQTALCTFYGLSWKNLKRDSSVAGFDDVESYFHQMTGFTWTQDKGSRTKKIYLPGESSASHPPV